MPHRLPLLVAYLARQPLAAFWAFYNTSLDAHPVLTKIATGRPGIGCSCCAPQRHRWARQGPAESRAAGERAGLSCCVTRRSGLRTTSRWCGTTCRRGWHHPWRSPGAAAVTPPRGAGSAQPGGAGAGLCVRLGAHGAPRRLRCRGQHACGAPLVQVPGHGKRSIVLLAVRCGQCWEHLQWFA